MRQRKPAVDYPLLLRRRPAEHAPSLWKFAYARTALTHGLRLLGLGSGDRMLIPEMVCDVVLAPLADAGIEPVYYPVTRTLAPDWNVIEAMDLSGVRALLMVHYFGQPQDIDRFRRFCDRRALRLVEDNAHGHGAIHDGRPLGTWGDIGISSPRKSFGVPSGGYLYLRSPAPPGARVPDPTPVQPISAARSIVRSAARLVLRPIWARLRPRVRPPYEVQGAFAEGKVPDWSMDSATDRYLARQDLARIRQSRQALYRVWEAWCVPRGLQPVFPSLAEGACPLVFPAWTGDHQASIAWFDWGFRHGIDVHSWPNLPVELAIPDSRAYQDWQRLVCFPIHQDMDPASLERELSGLHAPQWESDRKVRVV